MKRSALVAVLAVVLVGCGAGEIEDTNVEARLDTIRRATLKYRNRDAALKAGYRPLPRCIESLEGDGALGLEYIQLRLARDDKVDLLEPEQLFYEEQPGGKSPRLVGVGYFVPDEGQKPPSSPLGHLDGPIPAQYRGQSPHYELHAWVHAENSDGVLAFFNPDVSCLD